MDRGLIPEDLKEYRRQFAKMAREFFAVILKDRAIYDRNYRLWEEANGIGVGKRAGSGASGNPEGNDLSIVHMDKISEASVSLSHEDHYLLQAFRGQRLVDVPKSAPFRAMERIVRENGVAIGDLREAELQHAELQHAELPEARLGVRVATRTTPAPADTRKNHRPTKY